MKIYACFVLQSDWHLTTITQAYLQIMIFYLSWFVEYIASYFYAIEVVLGHSFDSGIVFNT